MNKDIQNLQEVVSVLVNQMFWSRDISLLEHERLQALLKPVGECEGMALTKDIEITEEE